MANYGKTDHPGLPWSTCTPTPKLEKVYRSILVCRDNDFIVVLVDAYKLDENFFINKNDYPDWMNPEKWVLSHKSGYKIGTYQTIRACCNVWENIKNEIDWNVCSKDTPGFKDKFEKISRFI